MAETRTSFAIADYDQCSETEALTTLNGLADPVDMDELFNQFFALLLVAATTIIAPTSAASLATASAPVSTTPTAAPAVLPGSFAFDASVVFSFNLVFFSHLQNHNPPSRENGRAHI